MKKLLSITLTIAVFCMLGTSALAAPANNQQPQDELWQYIQESDDFWNSIMKQIGEEPGQNNRPNQGESQKPAPQPPIIDNNRPGQDDNTSNDNNNNDNNNNNETNNGSQTNNSYVEQVLQLVNKERAARGLSSLRLDARVSAAAQVRAAECARSFSHTRPNGTRCFTALKEGGVSYRPAGENIAYGQRTPQAVMTDWMNSSGHRANILNSNYTTIGIGYTVINGTPYWSQFFIQ